MNNEETADFKPAERVVWRQLLRWIQSQLAMIDTGMVEATEVFMPYIQVEPGLTLWELTIAGGQLALPAAPEESSRFKVVK